MKKRGQGAVSRVADAIADGSEVDWGKEGAADPGLRETLDCLKVVQSILKGYRDVAEVASQEASRGGALPVAPPAAKSRRGRAAEPKPPERGLFEWGPLRIIEAIGEGSFGEVYRAIDPRLEREVALKLWRGTGTSASADRFLVEARRLARVRHPNVLVVHGADEHEGRPGMWADLIEGQSLEACLEQQGPSGANEAAMIGMELCRALAAVHAAGLVHRDVKTANVMRERGGRIVLMDFGAVGELSVSGAVRLEDGAVGTPLALAPEQLDGAPATVASDLYGLGVLLYRLLTGAYPVEARTLDELRQRHHSGQAVALRERRPDLPSRFVQAVERALAPVGSRYASPAAMERALAEVLETGIPASTGASRVRSGNASGRVAKVAAAPMFILPEVLTRALGREADLAACAQWVGPGQWLTLVGPAASGKTRLALRLAEQALPAFSDGVCFIDGESHDDAPRWVDEIARSLGSPGSTRPVALDSVGALVGRRSLLLVFDHCDRVREACARLGESLLARCPGVGLLVTCREPVAAIAERCHALDAFPASEAGPESPSDRVARHDPVDSIEAVAGAADASHAAFVGRAGEFAALDEAAEAARQRSGRTLLVAGEAGLGKSRLMEEARRRLEARGILCLSGRCSYRGGRNFEPFIEALEEFSRRFAPMADVTPEVRGAREEGPGVLFTGLRSMLDTRQLGLPDPQTREQVWLLLDSLLKRIARYETLALFLDDLHWADEGTTSLLNHVARNSRDARLLVVGGYRPEDVASTQDRGDSIQDALRLLSSTPGSRVLELEPLNPAESESLVHSMLGGTREPEGSALRIHDRARGNPFFTVELVRLLAAGASAGDEPSANADALPRTIADVVMRRLARLSPEDRDLLDVAAVEGERFHARTLQTATEMPRRELLKRLREIEQQHHLVVADEDGHHFSHGLVREVLLRKLPRELRREYHDVVATHLIGDFGDRSDHAGRIADQLYEAQRFEEAVSYFVTAAKDARRLFLYERSLGFLERALDGIGRTASPGAMHGEILCTKSATLLLLGRPQLAREVAEHALRLEAQRGDAQAEATAREALGEAALAQGDLEAAEGLLARAREQYALGADLHPLARCDQKLGAVATRRGDFTVALERLERALANLGSAGDERQRALVGLEIGDVLYRRGDFERAIATFVDAIAALRRLDERHDLARGLNRLGNALFQRGETEPALAHYREALALAVGLDDQQGRARFRANLGNVHLVRGETAAALECYHEALESFESIGDRTGAAQTVMALGNVCFTQGRYEEAARWYRDSRSRREELGDRFGLANSLDNLGVAEYHAGCFGEALAHCSSAARLRAELGDRPGCVESAINLGTLQAVLGDSRAGEHALAKAERLAGALGDSRRRSRAALGRGCLKWWAEDREGCAADVRRAASFGSDEPAVRARLLLLRGLLVVPPAGSAALALLRQGLEVAQNAGLIAEQATIRMALSERLLASGQMGEGWLLLDTALEFARTAPMPLLELRGMRVSERFRTPRAGPMGTEPDAGAERIRELVAGLMTATPTGSPAGWASGDVGFPLP